MRQNNAACWDKKKIKTARSVVWFGMMNEYSIKESDTSKAATHGTENK